MKKNPIQMKKKKTDPTMALNIAIAVVFSLLLLWGISLVKDKLLFNADEMGTNLAQSYAAEEENRISFYEMFMEFAALNMNKEIEENADPQKIQKWLAGYSDQLEEILGGAILDPYAVINGSILAADPWAGDTDYDYTGTEWYQNALRADGDVIFTNAYTDAVTGKDLVTIAKKLDGQNNVIAFDILLEKFHMYKNKASMPENSSYFLYDGNGRLIHAVTDMDLSRKEAADYTAQLRDAIQKGELQSHSSSIKDLNGKNRGVYYYTMTNGWLSVITIPIENILHDDWNQIIILLAILYLVLLSVMFFVMIKNYFQKRKNKHTEDTLRILGDTYYAIYRVNYENGTYESIKSSDDVRDLLGKSGSYSHLIQVVKTFVDEKTYEEFEQSFSPENIKKLIADKVYEFGGDYRRKFGDQYKWVSIRIIYNQALYLNEVIMCFREIDAEKHRQLQQHILLENALKSAKQTAEKKNVFFSNVSHDMRTPLNAIIELSELALEPGTEPEKTENYLEKIQKSGEQLLSLVNDILDMSRIEHGKEQSLDYKTMDLKSWFRQAASLFESTAEKEKKQFHTEIAINDSLVYCDPFRLNQILNNLLSNAFKYSEEGAGITVRLKEIASQNSSGKYQLIVEDTGIGMSEEFLEQIFEPFARETTFAPTRITGTGLGMPIVKSLVQQLSGEITVQSELGKGTVITVTVPLQIADPDPNPDSNPDSNPGTDSIPAAETETEKRKFSLKGKTILVAEDNEINMEILSIRLSMLGVKIIPAWNGREALELFQTLGENEIDAILMDMQMPEMDGCSASEAIRALPRADAKTVPIIAVTANAFAEDIAKTTAAGMNGHIAKPIDFDRLTELLSDYIRHSRLS